jgi:hypothetical protein
MAFRKKRKDPFREIQSCLQKRDYKGALDWFNTLLQKDKKNTQIRLRFADTLVLAGSKREAVKQYRIVADELAEKGFMIRAIAINKKIVQLDPSQSDIHTKLAAMNEDRSGSTVRRSQLAEALTRPDAPIQREAPTPPPEAPEAEPPSAPPPAPVTSTQPETPEVLSELSLEESMAMEFGTADAEPDEAPVAVTPPVEQSEEEELALEIDVGEQAPASLSGGFELVEEIEAGTESSQGLGDETPTFSEEPLELGSATETIEEAPEEEVEVVAAEEEETESPEIVLSIGPDETQAEAEEVVTAELVEGGEEMEVVELNLEPEPALAEDGIKELVGALGEDIDSLIDSIIDDVGTSALGDKPAEDEPPTHIPLFSDLSTPEFIDVAILLVRRVAKVGETIVREGDPGDSMFIISTGEVRATIESSGQQLPVATLRDGDFFGEMAVLSGEPRTATVTAVKNTELLELSRENLQVICSRHPHVEAKLRLAYDERVARSQS